MTTDSTTRKALDPLARGARRFENKVCVVAGAGQGIGLATVRRLATEGATVVIGDWAEDIARKAQEEVQGAGERPHRRLPQLGRLPEPDGARQERVGAHRLAVLLDHDWQHRVDAPHRWRLRTPARSRSTGAPTDWNTLPRPRCRRKSDFSSRPTSRETGRSAPSAWV